MHQILVYSDSLTWGIIPDTRHRLPFEKRCVGLADELKNIAIIHSTHYFDAACVTDTSMVDGIHLDANQHQILGQAIADAVRSNGLLTK